MHGAEPRRVTLAPSSSVDDLMGMPALPSSGSSAWQGINTVGRGMGDLRRALRKYCCGVSVSTSKGETHSYSHAWTGSGAGWPPCQNVRTTNLGSTLKVEVVSEWGPSLCQNRAFGLATVLTPQRRHLFSAPHFPRHTPTPTWTWTPSNNCGEHLRPVARTQW